MDAVLNQIQSFDETSRTENSAQRPVAPWHTSIRVGVICRAGPLVMPTKPTERLVAAGTGRGLPQRTSASSSKTKAKTAAGYLCRLAISLRISDPAPLGFDCQLRLHRGVHCIWFATLARFRFT